MILDDFFSGFQSPALRWGHPVQRVAPTRSNLIGKGMIYSPAHGETAFTVPLFDQYLKRTMPVP